MEMVSGSGSGSGTEMVAGSGSVAGVGSSSGSVVGTGLGSCSMVDAGFIAGSLVGEGVDKVADVEGKIMQEHPLHIARKRPSGTFSGQVCLGPLIEAGIKTKNGGSGAGSVFGTEGLKNPLYGPLHRRVIGERPLRPYLIVSFHVFSRILSRLACSTNELDAGVYNKNSLYYKSVTHRRSYGNIGESQTSKIHKREPKKN